MRIIRRLRRLFTRPRRYVVIWDEATKTDLRRDYPDKDQRFALLLVLQKIKVLLVEDEGRPEGFFDLPLSHGSNHFGYARDGVCINYRIDDTAKIIDVTRLARIRG
jgi:hypothetical protein